jgi:hypothetical protein
VVLDARTVTPIQSLFTLAPFACDGRQSGWRRPPRVVGCGSRNEVPSCCGTPVGIGQGVAGSIQC